MSFHRKFRTSTFQNISPASEKKKMAPTKNPQVWEDFFQASGDIWTNRTFNDAVFKTTTATLKAKQKELKAKRLGSKPRTSNLWDMLCLCHDAPALAFPLYGVFPVPIGQFISVTYPRRTSGKHFHIFARTRWPKTLWPRRIMRPRD